MKTEISDYQKQALEFLKATNTEFASEFKEFASMPWDKDGTKRNIFRITLKNQRHRYTFDFGSSLADSCKPHSKLAYSNEPVTLWFGFTQGTERQMAFRLKVKTNCTKLREIYTSKRWLSIVDREQLETAFLEYQESVEIENAKSKRRKEKGYHITKPLRDIENDLLIPQIIRKVVEMSKETDLGILQADEITHPTEYDALAVITKYDPGTFENFCSESGYNTDSRNAVRTYKAVRKEWNNVSKLFTPEQLEQLQDIS
jgi:hypothetical protein